MRSCVWLALAAVLLGGCGGSSKDKPLARPVGTAGAGGETAGGGVDAGGSPGPGEATAAPGATGKAGAPAKGTSKATAAPGATSAPVASAAPGTVNRPRTGRYVLDASGWASDPSSGQRQDYPPDSRVHVDVSSSDQQGYSSKQTLAGQEQRGSTTVETRWEAGRVLFKRLRIDAPPFFTFDCKLDTPVEILRIPVKPESFSGAGTGPGCRLSFEVKVVAREPQADAAGRTWSTWKIEAKTHYEFDSPSSLVGDTSQTQWLSPDLGFNVRGIADNDGTVTTPSGTFRSVSHQETVLRSYP